MPGPTATLTAAATAIGLILARQAAHRMAVVPGLPIS
jgi:hypothetical protein